MIPGSLPGDTDRLEGAHANTHRLVTVGDPSTEPLPGCRR